MERKYIITAFLVGFLYRLLIGVQGIDSVDSGFSNTFFQNIFYYPEAMPYNYNYYLTGLLGGVWNKGLGMLGMQGFRILEALTLSAAIMLMYLAFRSRITSTHIAVVAILGSFLFPSIVTTFHYNTLSFLFIALALYCYSLFLDKQKQVFLLLSGIAIGMGFFARIVNMSLLGLCMVPVLSGMMNQDVRNGARRAALLFAGIVSGCLCMVGVMAALGHLPYFLTALADDFGFVTGTENSHGSGNLLFVYLKSYVNIGLQVLAFCVFYLLYLGGQRLSTGWSRLVNIVLAVITLALVLTSLPYLSAIALCILLCSVLLMQSTTDEDHASLVLFALVATLLFPLGSDIGIPGIFHWVAGLLIFPAATFWPQATSDQRRAMTLCCVVIALSMVGRTVGSVYGEEASRLQCIERVQVRHLNTLTEPQKAETLRHIIGRINRYGVENHWLVLGNQASELYYATAHVPFLGNTQVDTYRGEGLAMKLDERYSAVGQAPVIVFLYDSYHQGENDADIQEVLTQWMQNHDYGVAFTDSILTIYQTEEEIAAYKQKLKQLKHK